MRLLLFLSFAWILWGCAKTYHPRYSARPYLPPTPVLPGGIQMGMASWYGKEFHGKRTASGEIFNMYAFTAAHRTLPFGTYARVRNLDNGRSVVVRINDRGPFTKGRIIDLSYAAARAIGMVGPGIARVVLNVLSYKPRPLVPVGLYYVQVGSFIERERAYALQGLLLHETRNVLVMRRVVKGVTYYSVRLGPYFTRAEALSFGRYLKGRGLPGLVVRE